VKEPSGYMRLILAKICLAGEKANMTELAKSLTRKNDFTSKPTEHGRQYEEVALKA
jgi:hypothetical protein